MTTRICKQTLVQNKSQQENVGLLKTKYFNTE